MFLERRPALREFVAARQEVEASNAEINRELAVLRRAFNLAIQAGRLLAKPHFPMLKERNTRTGFLERDQINRICVALEATQTAEVIAGTSSDLATSSALPFATGWRTASESCHSNGARSIGRCPFGPPHDEERRGAVVPVHGRHREGAQRPVCDSRAEGDRASRAVRLPPRRRAHRVFPGGVGERLQGGRLPECPVHDMRRSAVRTFERAGCRARPRCRWWATRPSRSTGATPSWTKRCSAKQRPGLTHGRRLRVRQRPLRQSGQSVVAAVKQRLGKPRRERPCGSACRPSPPDQNQLGLNSASKSLNPCSAMTTFWVRNHRIRW